jgi:hypothetical protein
MKGFYFLLTAKLWQLHGFFGSASMDQKSRWISTSFPTDPQATPFTAYTHRQRPTMAIYEPETLQEIRDYQNRSHGSLVPLPADDEGVYPSGDPDSPWWTTKMVYNPSQLPATIDEVPRYCFLSDRVIAWIGTTQLKTVTGDQRHKFWPADFANGREMNTSRARRAHVGSAFS